MSGSRWGSVLPFAAAALAIVWIVRGSVEPPPVDEPTAGSRTAPSVPVAPTRVAASADDLDRAAWDGSPFSDARADRGEPDGADREPPSDPFQAQLAAARDAMLVGDLATAERLLLEALDEAEGAGPDDPRVADVLDELGEVAWRGRKADEAIGYHERAVAERERVLGRDHPDVAKSLDKLAEVLAQSPTRRDEALTSARRALEIREAALGPDHPDLAASLTLVARTTRLVEGNAADAESRAEIAALYERAVDITREVYGADSPELAKPLRDLAAYHSANGDWDQARKLAEQSVEVLDGGTASDPRTLSTSLSYLAHVADRQKDDAAAESAYRRSIEASEQAFGEVGASGGYMNLGKFYASRGRPAEAEAQYDRAVSVLEDSYGASHASLVKPLGGLAESLEKQGRVAEAESAYRRAITIAEDQTGSSGSALYTLRLNVDGLAVLLAQEGRDAEAAELQQYSADLLARIRGEG